MADRQAFAYQPDYAIPPGESIQEALDSRGMVQADLAQRTGKSAKHINEVIRGKAAITPDFALQLERVLGAPASFWNNRERRYQEALALERERKALGEHVAWLQKFPVAELRKRGYVSATRSRIAVLRDVLSFFGVTGPEQWEATWTDFSAQFRKSAAVDTRPGALAAWLRIGELEAAKITCAAYDAAKFQDVLPRVRRLTTLPPDEFIPRVRDLLRPTGVAFVVVREIRGAPVSGATRWLGPSKALIQLSLRYKSDDQFWFSFFHEAGHIVLHAKKAIFLESGARHGAEEDAANRFAADALIPPQDYRALRSHGEHFGRAEIAAFSQRLGIAPGIVVGRLQHDKRLPHTHLNGLKLRFNWAGAAHVA